MEPLYKTRTCRICGCTDAQPCQPSENNPFPCWWIGNELCSRCYRHRRPYEASHLYVHDDHCRRTALPPPSYV